MMTFLDTNVLVDFLFVPEDQSSSPRFKKVLTLFDAISSGSTQALLSEVVLHESFYVLVIRGKYIEPRMFCEILREMLTWPGWAMDPAEMAIVSRAFEYLIETPKLELSDAIIAARAEAHGAELATFDKRLAQAYGGPIWADS